MFARQVALRTIAQRVSQRAFGGHAAAEPVASKPTPTLAQYEAFFTKRPPTVVEPKVTASAETTELLAEIEEINAFQKTGEYDAAELAEGLAEATMFLERYQAADLRTAHLAAQSAQGFEEAKALEAFRETYACSNDLAQELASRSAYSRLTPAQYEGVVEAIKASDNAKFYPEWTRHTLAVAEAYRTHKAVPDVFTVSRSTPKVFTPEQLGTGNYNQKLFNEYLYEVQNCPERATKFGAGRGTEFLSIDWTGKQSIIYLAGGSYAAFYGAYLYRQMYIEKYNLWDMLIWENRVLANNALQERGW